MKCDECGGILFENAGFMTCGDCGLVHDQVTSIDRYSLEKIHRGDTIHPDTPSINRAACWTTAREHKRSRLKTKIAILVSALHLPRIAREHANHAIEKVLDDRIVSIDMMACAITWVTCKRLNIAVDKQELLDFFPPPGRWTFMKAITFLHDHGYKRWK